MILQVILYNTTVLADGCINRVPVERKDPRLKCRRMSMTLHRKIWAKTRMELRKRNGYD